MWLYGKERLCLEALFDAVCTWSKIIEHFSFTVVKYSSGSELSSFFLMTPGPELNAVMTFLSSFLLNVADCSTAINMLISFLQPILCHNIKCEQTVGQSGLW